jgi:hypothetical protein
VLILKLNNVRLYRKVYAANQPAINKREGEEEDGGRGGITYSTLLKCACAVAQCVFVLLGCCARCNENLSLRRSSRTMKSIITLILLSFVLCALAIPPPIWPASWSAQWKFVYSDNGSFIDGTY